MQQPKTPNTRRIRQVSVTNLFGIFNHVIPLNMDEHITIVHGPNGFGKTVMLKLLYALFSQSHRLLQITPFDEFRIDFEDNTSFWVSKTLQSQGLTGDEHSIKHEIVFQATGEEPYTLPSRTLIKGSTFPSSLIERLIPDLERVGGSTWKNRLTGEILSLEDIVNQFGDRLPTGINSIRARMPKWLADMRASVPIGFIETQRLLSSTQTRRSEYAVTEASKHIVEVIKGKLAESANLSQSLDSTFPQRAIRPTAQQLQVTKDELLKKLQKLEEKRSGLMTVGLLDQETGPRFPMSYDQRIDETTKTVLAVYAEDTERKLGIFDELARKIDLLTTIINNLFLYKAMTINKERGLVFTTRNGVILPLEDLSSGEQHELVLFYDLLFNVSSGTLILIDEPELSLHVVWQRQFLKDIQEVTKLTKIDIILATHSPGIIDDRRDLLVRLKGPENGKLEEANGK